MTPAYDLSCNDRVLDWLTRVNTQYDEETLEKVKAADSERARQTLESNTIYHLFFSSPRPLLYTPSQPASRGWFSSGDTITHTNSHNITNIHHTHVYNHSVDSSSDSEDESVKGSKGAGKKKKPKTNWKGIAAIGVVSTAIAGVSIFVYARLSKAAEGARNYLENTKKIETWASTSTSINSDPRISQIAQIAQIQTKIDQRALNKITNYKYSILTSLVGMLAIAGGGITILASTPAVATAGATAVIAGGVLNSLAVMYAAYNCGMHWSDDKDGKKEFAAVKGQIPNLINAFSHRQSQINYSAEQEYPPPACNPNWSCSSQSSALFEAPPSYNESQATYQAIYNQRAGIYPDLNASAPMEMRELPTKY